MKADTTKLFIGAGLLTWALTAFPTLLHGRASPAWVVASVLFAAAYVVTVRAPPRARRVRVAGLAAQSVAAVVLAWTSRSGYSGALLAVIAGEAPFILQGASAPRAWIAAQTLAFAAAELSLDTPRFAVASVGAYIGFQLFAFGAARLALSEADARAEVARINAELMATRELFADATRETERLRIARDLHDSLGHHLTALSINLEVARKARGTDQEDALARSHAIAKDLLSSVRDVVGTMREVEPLNLAHALRTLVTGVPHLTVHLALPDALEVRDTAVLHVVFRCVQEAVTNAARHARAENVWIDVKEDRGALAVSARDDGRGAASVERGHGLTGLAERVEAFGGHIEVVSRPGEGFTLRALLPARGTP